MCCRTVSSIFGLHPLRTSTTPLFCGDNLQCLQIVPNVPGRAKPSPTECQRILWPIINAYALNGSSYHYPLDLGFQIEEKKTTVVLLAFWTSYILPMSMFSGGKDGKQGKADGLINT